MKDDFFIKIETWHKPDIGTTENVSLIQSYKNMYYLVYMFHKCS